jgi:hypothetical protein
MLKEKLHNIRVTITRCRPQWPIDTSVDVCAVLEEELHSVRATIH